MHAETTSCTRQETLCFMPLYHMLDALGYTIT